MLLRAAAKEEAEEGKKKKGGISIPEYWPWEDAKKLFEHPDVIPAKDVEVSYIVSIVQSELLFMRLCSSSGKHQT